MAPRSPDKPDGFLAPARPSGPADLGLCVASTAPQAMREKVPRVDAVVTWVDGSDPAWRRRRALHAVDGHDEALLSTANVEGRFRARGELRYLLRSLEEFWPFRGDIILVTDRQRPAWLRPHPRLRVVDHREFIEARYLPTFSSRAIEASLHRIAGLAEHFVSFNDDFFLTRRAEFADFFGAGGRFYLAEESVPETVDARTRAAPNDACNARQWMRRHIGRAVLERLPAHAPRGLRRSWLAAMERRHPALFQATRAERFRRCRGQSIVVNVYPEWCLAQGRGEARPSQSLYLTTDRLEQDPAGARRILCASLHRALSACINDTTDNRADRSGLAASYRMLMQAVLPEPSVFESAESGHIDAASTAPQACRCEPSPSCPERAA